MEGDAADSSILLAQGNVAQGRRGLGDTLRAREMLASPDDPWHPPDLISLQGLIAHQRGEWFDRFRMEPAAHARQATPGDGPLRRAPVRGGVRALRADALPGA